MIMPPSPSCMWSDSHDCANSSDRWFSDTVKFPSDFVLSTTAQDVPEPGKEKKWVSWMEMFPSKVTILILATAIFFSVVSDVIPAPPLQTLHILFEQFKLCADTSNLNLNSSKELVNVSEKFFLVFVGGPK